MTGLQTERALHVLRCDHVTGDERALLAASSEDRYQRVGTVAFDGRDNADGLREWMGGIVA